MRCWNEAFKSLLQDREREKKVKRQQKEKVPFFCQNTIHLLLWGKKKNLLYFIGNYFFIKWGFTFKWVFLLRSQHLAWESLLLPA